MSISMFTKPAKDSAVQSVKAQLKTTDKFKVIREQDAKAMLAYLRDTFTKAIKQQVTINELYQLKEILEEPRTQAALAYLFKERSNQYLASYVSQVNCYIAELEQKQAVRLPLSARSV